MKTYNPWKTRITGVFRENDMIDKNNKSQTQIQTELMEKMLDEMTSNRLVFEVKLNQLTDLIAELVANRARLATQTKKAK